MSSKLLKSGVLALTLAATTGAAHAAVSFVGGAAMYSDKPIAANAVNAPKLTTLVAAVKAAGLVDTLAGPGPLTMFAPTNFDFSQLPDATVETLLKPENKGQLTKVLTAHVVSANITRANLRSAVKENGGSYSFQTVSRDQLTAKQLGLAITITDESGRTAFITNPDVGQANGVVHVVNKVLLPK